MGLSRVLVLSCAALLVSGCSDGAFATFNDEPGASILSPEDGAVFREGEAIALRGFVDDNRTPARELLVSWSSSIEGQLYEGPPDDDTGSTELSLAFAELGDHTLTLRVVDPRGGIGMDTVSVTVLENQAPQPLIISPDPEGVYHSDVPVPLIGAVSDAEDLASELLVTWIVDDVVFVQDEPADDAGYNSQVAPLAEGPHKVELEVVDTEGKSASAVLSFQVRGPNGLPECSLDLPEDGEEFTQGEIISFLGTASDPDVPSSSLAVEWSSSADGILGNSTPADSGTVTLDTTEISGGTPTITMIVTDEVGATCADSVQIVVESPPSVTVLEPVAGSTYALGALVPLQSQVSDVQDPPANLSIEWSSDLDGLLGADTADTTGFQTGAVGSLTAGDHLLSVSVTDTAGLTTVESALITVSAPPGAPVLGITPNPATSGDDLTATILSPAFDPEGDSLTYTWSWTKGGVLQPALNGATVVPALETEQGDTWEVFAFASDGWSDGPTASASLTVGNAPPVATAPTLTPGTLYTNTLATCSGATATDADGDPVTIALSWEVNGQLLGVTGAIANGLAWFDKGDTVECFATPNDGLSDGARVGSGAVVVANSAPLAPVVGIIPAAPDPVDDLTCALVAPSTDPDPGDTVTHTWEWQVNGATAGLSAPTVAASFTADQDLWTCDVTATDGAATSPAGSDTVTVCQNETWYQDNDGDGFGDFATEVVACASPANYVPEAGDCDDSDPLVYPTAGDSTQDTVDSDCDGMDCEAGELNGVYFVVCLDNGDWFDAQTACQSAGYDGLATFANAAEETFVVNLLLASGGASQDPWIGFTDQGSPGTFSWTDGIPVTYQNWDTGQPDSGGTGNDCAVLTAQQGASGGWDDIACTSGSAGWTSYACGSR